jgi:hypothetical protein
MANHLPDYLAADVRVARTSDGANAMIWFSTERGQIVVTMTLGLLVDLKTRIEDASGEVPA